MSARLYDMKKTDIPKLDARLMLAASFVCGPVAADIGTDHAYIPIYLIKSGICTRAVATDINKGPLDTARKNAAEYGIKNEIDFFLADGLRGVQTNGVTDIVICGMGGEMISRIISESEYIKTDRTRLILQPMSAADKLRRYLYENGFLISDGSVASVGGKVYQCLVCTYDGVRRHISDACAMVGDDMEHIRQAALFPVLLEKYIDKIKASIKGKTTGGLDVDDEYAILTELESIRGKNK